MIRESGTSATTANSQEAAGSTISQPHLAWLESRKVSCETASRMGLWSGVRRDVGGDGFAVEPDPRGDILAFPFHDRGQISAIKYRGPGKKFYQRPNPKKTFYNADVLDDPALETNALVIVEGEMDCLAVIEAGYPFVVSVPNGAVPGRDKNGKLIDVPETADGIDPEHDEAFSYIAANWDRLEKVKRITIATDADDNGRRLAAELVRRLGRVRCSFVTFPQDCKDMNDVLAGYGASTVTLLLAQAQPYPVSGVYTASGFPEEPPLVPVSTGWPALDPFILIYRPSLVVVSGFANSGKTTWANELVGNLARLHGWKAAIASFEMRIKPFVTEQLMASYLNAAKPWSQSERAEAWAWLNEHFCFIAPEPDKDEETGLEWLLDKASAAVIRHGIKVLLVDPWNEIDHSRRRDETQSEYVSRALRTLKRFGRRMDLTIILVAHPAKAATNKADADVSLYDISDSAHFANKADQGVILSRRGSETDVRVKKVRYQPETGTKGEVAMRFHPARRVFEVVA